MRAVVLVLAGLAGLKIWTHAEIYRSATTDALIAAYRDRAIDACRNVKGLRAAASSSSWSRSASVRLEIGDSNVDVAIWDVDNPLWGMRYKYPLIIVDGGADATCRYDVTLGTASVARGRG